ncbi:MAG: Arylsulfatase [candidate division BRC1 bacterium ADurb.BinA364]|nr:MAG: Arylsulfatase [candidate division BRC1 bacterium ADurb.BinA364]
MERTEELFRHYRCLYAGLLAMCDANLGKVLDLMDEYGMWDDTMLIVNTDHGFLLGEHGLLGKIGMSYFEEIANIPLFIWDPRARVQGERRGSLAQTIDIAPTLLQYFGVPIPPDMQGRPLDETIAEDKPVREAALYGTFGGHVFCVDGRYCYRRPQAADAPRRLYDFTLMCTHMRSRFSPAELKDFDLAGPFSFTKGCRVLRIPFESPKAPPALGQPTLWDLLEDPGQERPIGDPEIELRMIDRMIRLMKDNAAPPEQFARLGLAE